MKSLIDLHMHSTASDGKDTPKALLEKIKSLGIRCFALTDHDTIDGVVEMEKALASDDCVDITFIRGIEFSCITSVGKCHILGYGYDLDHSAFKAVLEKSAGLRRRKLEQRLDFLRQEYQIEFAEADIEIMRHMKSVGKPHLAELMIKMGLVDSVAEAVNKYIDHCPTLDSRMPADEVVHAIKASGGISVWAHPYGGVGEKVLSDEEFQAQRTCLMGIGIQGLECYYSQYTKTRIEALTACASENNLYISGGSDYHGRKNFPELGTLNADGISVNSSQMTVLQSLNKVIDK